MQYTVSQVKIHYVKITTVNQLISLKNADLKHKGSKQQRDNLTSPKAVFFRIMIRVMLMLSLRGSYENGKIIIQHSLPNGIPESSNVLLTFVTDFAETDENEVIAETIVETGNGLEENKNEEYYKSIREFERVDAHGNITIIDQEDRYTFPLNDYSQGGLSFISERQFDIGQQISSGITDPMNPDLVLMELQMEVRGIFQTDDKKYKIGCMFLDSVDEDLWHGLLQYLS